MTSTISTAHKCFARTVHRCELRGAYTLKGFVWLISSCFSVAFEILLASSRVLTVSLLLVVQGSSFTVEGVQR